MSELPPVFEPGVAIAPGYEVIEHVSRSRAFDVYDVWSEERECRCIAKTVRPDRADNRVARRRLENEGRLLRRLSHPHIVRAYPRPETTGPVIVMETLSGETLAHLIEYAARLSPAEIGHLGVHLCSAVQYLHRHRVLHLDLKPSNIVADGGRARIIDLSVARRPGRAPAGVGTWSYMSPEQVRGGELTPAADVWGIGIVLWEAATGRPAFGGEEDDVPSDDTGEPLPADEHPQLLRAADPVGRHRRLPGPLAEAIDAALAPRPTDRPSIAVLAGLLEQVPDVASPRSPAPAMC